MLEVKKITQQTHSELKPGLALKGAALCLALILDQLLGVLHPRKKQIGGPPS